MAVHGLGERTAAEVAQWFDDEENQAVIAGLLARGVQPVEAEPPQSDELTGQTWVFTGKLERLSRDEAERMIHVRGGKTAGSVSKGTTCVVAGPGAGSKLTRAEALKVPVLTEDEFLARFLS
ncbi:MAG: hypothetical protein C4320_02415 [Armatimonadota bacterium]